VTWSRVTASRFETITGSPATETLDPYLVWADLTRMRGFSNLPEFEARGGLPVLLRVDDRERLQALIGAGAVCVAPPHAGQTFCTAWVSRSAPDAFVQLRQAGPFELGIPAFSWLLGALSATA
jgi:hypothetical protein